MISRWFTISGGDCQLNHIGANFFYSWGHFRYEFRRGTDNVTPDWNELNSENSAGFQHVTYMVGNDSESSLHFPRPKRHFLFPAGVVDCVTPDIVDLLHGIMGSCVLALITNLTALYADLIGVKNSFLRWIRRNAIFSVLSGKRIAFVQFLSAARPRDC